MREALQDCVDVLYDVTRKFGYKQFAPEFLRAFEVLRNSREALAQTEPVELTDETVTIPVETWDAVLRLVNASNELDHHAEEYDFDDGMGRGAQQTFWDDFSGALIDMNEVIATHEAKTTEVQHERAE